MGGSITNAFSGGQQQGYNTIAGGYGNAINELNGMYNQAYGGLDPYNKAGQNAIGNYSNFANGLQSEMNGNWMKGYQENPYAQYLTNKELGAANNAAAAGGILGTGPNQQENMQIANNVTDQDMQTYFNNMQAQNQQYLGSQGTLMGNGLNAALGQGQLASGFGGDISKAMVGQSAAEGNSDVAGTQGKNSAIGSVLGMGSNMGSGSSNGGSGKSLASLFSQLQNAVPAAVAA